jgi:hypothetical protein
MEKRYFVIYAEEYLGDGKFETRIVNSFNDEKEALELLKRLNKIGCRTNDNIYFRMEVFDN